MTRILAVFLLSAIALLADVSGKWSGSFIPDGQDAESAVLHLKQDGPTITGTAGPSEEQQMAIRAGKVDGDKVSFEVALECGHAIRFGGRLAEALLGGSVAGGVAGLTRSPKAAGPRPKCVRRERELAAARDDFRYQSGFSL